MIRLNVYSDYSSPVPNTDGTDLKLVRTRLPVVQEEVKEVNIMLECWIDGGCEPNPGGTAAYGIVVLRQTEVDQPRYYILGNEVVWEEGKVIGSGHLMSNNVAEYAGLIAFFKWYIRQLEKDRGAIEEGEIEGEKCIVFSDSQLLVNQMNRRWEFRKGLYKPYYEEAFSIYWGNSILTELIEIRQIPREQNLADAICTKALAEVGIVRKR